MACLSENIEREEGAREEEMNSGSSGSILKILGGQPRHFAAPMVDASELAFRMLVRRYGAHVCYTPMIHSKLFLEKKKYRKEAFNTAPGDRPLIAQLCGNDPNIVCQVAKMLENDVDAIDMNFGCPQRIAQKGFYGAFLLDHVDLMVDIVRELSKSVKVPITCKIRIVDDEEETLSIAKRLEEAGCSLLTVHGRTRKMVKGNFGPADMDIIRKIK